jgi:septum formation protein
MTATQLTTVLASASPARLAVLRAAGIDPVVFVSGVDEPAVEADNAGAGPAGVVTALARAKAEAVLPAVAAAHPDAVVIGCDSMLLMNGRLRGKPADAAQVRSEWAEMAGSTGTLLTGHAVLVVRDGQVTARSADHRSTTIRFGSPSPMEIDAYLATGEPLLVAGGLTIDGYGGWFVEGLDGDSSSVIGISLPLTRQLLAEVGVAVIDLWRPAAGQPQTQNREGA